MVLVWVFLFVFMEFLLWVFLLLLDGDCFGRFVGSVWWWVIIIVFKGILLDDFISFGVFLFFVKVREKNII